MYVPTSGVVGGSNHATNSHASKPSPGGRPGRNGRTEDELSRTITSTTRCSTTSELCGGTGALDEVEVESSSFPSTQEEETQEAEV